MKLEQVPTPAYVIDLAKLEANCRILQYVQEEAGCKVLLAQKAYSLYKKKGAEFDSAPFELYVSFIYFILLS